MTYDLQIADHLRAVPAEPWGNAGECRLGNGGHTRYEARHPLESVYSDARRTSLSHRSELRARCIVAADAARHTRRSTTVNNPLRFVAGACTVGCW